MSFADDMLRFKLQVQTRTKEIFDAVVQEATHSIVEGSEITSAPGQPVGQYGPGYHNGRIGGTLKASWQARSTGELEAVISTDVPYAPYIEEGGNSRGPFQLRSSVGGFHSVKLTIAGMPRIVDVVTARVAGGT
jgi:hypothetical protein